MTDPRTPIFWRDARMPPHVELRKVEDGREVCYALHTHRHWSIGGPSPAVKARSCTAATSTT